MQQEWALRRKRMGRFLWLLNDPRRLARRFSLDETQVEEVSKAYRKWLRTHPQVWKLGRGRIRRTAALGILWKKGLQGPAIQLSDGERRRLSDEEAAITKQSILAARREHRGGSTFDEIMRGARSIGLRQMLPQADELLDSRLMVCRLCERVFVRPWKSTAQRYCPVCQQRYSPKQRWSRAKRPEP